MMEKRLCGQLKGSLTVEASVVLPMFIFAIVAIFYLIEGIRFSSHLENSLRESAQKLGTWAYAYEHLTSSESIGGYAGSMVVSTSLARGQVIKDLGSAYIKAAPVKGGEGGINMLGSRVLAGDQMIDLVAVWTFDPPFLLFDHDKPMILNRARVRAFTGYDNTLKEDKKSSPDEEIVFITPSGSVYHRSRNCYHLNVSIREVSEGAVGGCRNDSGGKYYKCEFCGGAAGGGNLYITSSGDRYHRLASCPGLKRTVLAVPISEVGGRRACKDCSR